ncbi:MAG: hypothetical protein AAFZ38_06665 [Myxococcota bacterium]
MTDRIVGSSTPRTVVAQPEQAVDGPNERSSAEPQLLTGFGPTSDSHRAVPTSLGPRPPAPGALSATRVNAVADSTPESSLEELEGSWTVETRANPGDLRLPVRLDFSAVETRPRHAEGTRVDGCYVATFADGSEESGQFDAATVSAAVPYLTLKNDAAPPDQPTVFQLMFDDGDPQLGGLSPDVEGAVIRLAPSEDAPKQCVIPMV